MAKTTAFEIKDFSFTYPGKETPALRSINLNIEMGEMIAICGRSGSGKSTLLRNLKPVLAPFGETGGRISFFGTPLENLGQAVQAAGIGYVLQNPDAQIVTDKVWHELAFGLESLGMDTKTIRIRVAEMASFFGIQNWFNKDVNNLSGGQKQILNLASVMAMQPDVLILDEPTSQLDPIAAADFLETVGKINRELGTTVIITEHRLEEVLPMADRAVVLDNGEIIACDTPANVGSVLAIKDHPMFMAMPTPLQAYGIMYNRGVGQDLECPIDVRHGRGWLTELLQDRELSVTALPADEESIPTDPETGRKAEPVIEMKDVWFRYDRAGEDVIRDLSMKVYRGEIFCIVGGNGTGKTTTLSIAAGLRKPYRGKVVVGGNKSKPMYRRDADRKAEGIKVAMLPQNPQSIFVESTLRADLEEVYHSPGQDARDKNYDDEILRIAQMVEIDHLLEMHPYDLSGGEQQRAALAKVLLTKPDILLLDEPTKGIDNWFKHKLAGILMRLKETGITIVMVSHDVEFCGRYGDRCAMFFDGRIISTNAPRTFFSGNSFYTTAANRMSRHMFTNAVNVDDIVELISQNIANRGAGSDHDGGDNKGGGIDNEDSPRDDVPGETNESSLDTGKPIDELRENPCQDVNEGIDTGAEESLKGRKFILDIGTFLAAAMTIYVGFFALDNKHYMAVCMLLVFYAMIPFFVGFERKSPKAREIVIISVLIATAVVGRAAFFMIPSFKPILAIIIISGVALGKEAGFLVGAMSAFVSNFLFGQGPWTPWQMIAMAIVGYLAGLIFSRYYGRAADESGKIDKNVSMIPLVIFGGLAVFILYGLIVDIWTILVMTPEPTMATIITVYSAAIYYNLVHGIATVIFLLLLSRPMLNKIGRVKIKYGTQ